MFQSTFTSGLGQQPKIKKGQLNANYKQLKYLIEATIKEAEEAMEKIKERYIELKHQESVNRRSQATNSHRQVSLKNIEEIQTTVVENNRFINKMI